jgi:hypothetical protein
MKRVPSTRVGVPRLGLPLVVVGVFALLLGPRHFCLALPW